MIKQTAIVAFLLFALMAGVFAPVAAGQAFAKTGVSSSADEIINDGKKYLGTPYDLGAPYGQTRTFDCSSFTKTIFAENGIQLPRLSKQQANIGEPVSRSNLQKGDLVFFSTKSSNGQIAHVGLYIGNGQLLHTWGPGGVRIDDMNSGWLDSSYISARRVL